MFFVIFLSFCTRRERNIFEAAERNVPARLSGRRTKTCYVVVVGRPSLDLPSAMVHCAHNNRTTNLQLHTCVYLLHTQVHFNFVQLRRFCRQTNPLS